MASLTIYQTIQIQMIKIGHMTNSSILQIGSTGCIQAQSDIYNTGQSTTLAEPAYAESPVSTDIETTLIPLAPTP